MPLHQLAQGSRYVENLIQTIIYQKVKRATKYLSPTLVVRATSVGKPDRRGPLSARVHIGAPNYRERKFIKLCQKADQRFPLQKIQIER